MSKSLILAAALLTTSVGGAFAQQPSTPTVWGAPYHGPTNLFGSAGSDNQLSSVAGLAGRGDAQLMSLDTNEAQPSHKHSKQPRR